MDRHFIITDTDDRKIEIDIVHDGSLFIVKKWRNEETGLWMAKEITLNVDELTRIIELVEQK